MQGEDTRERVRHAGEPGRSGGSGAEERGGSAGTGGGEESSPAAASAGTGGGRVRPRGNPRGPGIRGRRRTLRWVASVLSLLILGTAGAGYLYYEHLNANIKTDDLNLGKNGMADHKANAAGQTPLNILLIGSDARDSAANKALGGARDTFDGPPLADVQMLVHLSADRSNMSVISMPRDTVLKIPECTDREGKVFEATGWTLTNESLQRGGPGCTVATWYKLTGITIDHFMQVDFAGVVSMADAIGGVPVCVTQNVHSRNSAGQGSGLKLKAGTTFVKGEQALQWLRTRYGFKDGTDLARTEAQHMYMNSMVRELRKSTKLTDPAKLRNLAEAATSALTVDAGLDTVAKLYALAEEFQQVPTERITMTTMPNFYTHRPYFAGKVEPLQPDAEQVFRMVREDIPLDGKASKRTAPAAAKDPAAAPDEIGVSVQNGTHTDELGAARGRATEIAGVLTGKGFTRATADKQTNPQERTVVFYPSAELAGDAQAVAKAVGLPVSSVKRSTDVSGVTLVVGADWREGAAYPKPAAEDDGKAPSSAKPLSADNTKACMPVQPGFTW
ncbi:LCP family protein [Streptomyces sp. HNM0645]|uniref:LCP family protein n=1 Tax=Streptomyces sp. HNM0645 TaxID=2782343 RepID=UPI0024B782D3|nr:LCP family protein [Streptomyces sp. HNM0645]MDI9886617.1 LCP family protein [Streptomyces sp. HNM0645]